MAQSPNRISQRRRVERQLIDFLDHTTLDLAFIEAVAGDIPLDDTQKQALEELKARRGAAMYSDFLFALTHQYFPVEQASKLWEEILRHKWEMSEVLKRNVGLQVAALDYMQNIEELLEDTLLITRPSLAVVAEVALRDGLTGLYDHSTFSEKLLGELRRYRRYGNHISLIMVDIDHFKRHNDTYGHQAGDRVLVELSKIFLHEVRDVDVVARYGGEEFVIMLPRTDSTEAVIIAERIRLHVQERFFRSGDVTISLGVATCPQHGDSAPDLIESADKALYLSKHRGRNHTTLFGAAAAATAAADPGQPPAAATAGPFGKPS